MPVEGLPESGARRHRLAVFPGLGAQLVPGRHHLAALDREGVHRPAMAPAVRRRRRFPARCGLARCCWPRRRAVEGVDAKQGSSGYRGDLAPSSQVTGPQSGDTRSTRAACAERLRSFRRQIVHYDVKANLIFTWGRDPRSKPAADAEAAPPLLSVAYGIRRLRARGPP